jgi:hypothetical protein
MRAVRERVGCVFGAAALCMACGGSAKSGGEAGSIAAGEVRAWNVQGTATYDDGSGAKVTCPNLSFVLAQSADGKTFTAGSPGDAYQAAFTSDGTGAGTYTTKAMRFAFPNTGSPCGSLARIDISKLTLSYDAVDRVDGTAVGTAEIAEGDIGFDYPLNATFSGTQDLTPPAIEDLGAELSPLFGASFEATEPLTSDSALSLSGTTELPLVATPGQDDAKDVNIGFASTTVLPLSGSWTQMGVGSDLVGNVLATSPRTFQTPDDPGVFPEDGFESGLMTGLWNANATVVPGRGAATAISGTESLWIDGTASFHLRRKGTEKTLRFSAQAVFGNETDICVQTDQPIGFDPAQPFASLNVTAGVVGGTAVTSSSSFAPSTSPDPDATVITGDPAWPSASAVQQVSIDLNDAGEDVLVTLDLSRACGQVNWALMIDDLRLE